MTETRGKTIGVGMIGFGTVGRGVARLLHDEKDRYAARCGQVIDLASVLVRDKAKAVAAADEFGVNPAIITDDADAFFAAMCEADGSIVLEVAGGLAMQGPIERAIENGLGVVTANKSLLAFAGRNLFELAKAKKTPIAFEASCGGGIPIVTALRFGLGANRIEAMMGILNGTCNYILTEMTRKGRGYEESLTDAQAKGFAEADPTLDISGRDAAEKLAILASLAFGTTVDPDAIPCAGIDGLDLDNIKLAAEMGYDVQLLGVAERRETDAGSEIGLRVEPCFIESGSLLAEVRGSFNALAVYGSATGVTTYIGRGAGQMPTASAVVSDLLNIASGVWAERYAQTLVADGDARVTLSDDLTSRFFLRLSITDKPGALAHVASVLGEAGISLSAILQHEADPGQSVTVVVTTHEADMKQVTAAIDKIKALPVTDGPVVCIRILEMPEG